MTSNGTVPDGPEDEVDLLAEDPEAPAHQDPDPETPAHLDTDEEATATEEVPEPPPWRSRPDHEADL
jgi:hypothetical protein